MPQPCYQQEEVHDRRGRPRFCGQGVPGWVIVGVEGWRVVAAGVWGLCSPGWGSERPLSVLSRVPPCTGTSARRLTHGLSGLRAGPPGSAGPLGLTEGAGTRAHCLEAPRTGDTVSSSPVSAAAAMTTPPIALDHDEDMLDLFLNKEGTALVGGGFRAAVA